MAKWSIVYAKEIREMWSNKKWIWIPLVFLLLGITQPVSAYFMPQILKLSGSMPKGAIIQIPTPSPSAVVAQAQSQMSSLGLLILVLACMGTISAEREHGVLELILVKPVSFLQYVFAKGLAAYTLTAVSLLMGYLGAWYYTVQLIGAVPLFLVLSGAALFALWLFGVLSLTLLFSVLLTSPAAAAACSIIATLVVSIPSHLLKWTWSPSYLTTHAANLIGNGWPANGSSIIGSTVLCIVSGALCVAIAAVALKTRVVTRAKE